MFDELWSEINDMPGEIFDIPEMKDDDGDDTKSLEDFLKTNNDFWGKKPVGEVAHAAPHCPLNRVY